MMSGIPIVVYIDDQTSKGLANILQSTRRVTTATERWGSSANRATKEVNSSFTDLLGRLYALRYGMTKLFEGLSGYTQMTQMKMSFRALGGNLEQLRGVTQGLTSDYELLNIGIQMAAVGVNKQLTAAFLKAGTGVKQTMGNIVNLNELVESIIQGRTYMYFDKYLPGIARYGKELKAAQQESDALVRTQKTLQIVMKHMDELSAGLYGNISAGNKAMMKFQAVAQNMGRWVTPILEGFVSIAIAMSGVKIAFGKSLKGFWRLDLLKKLGAIGGQSKRTGLLQTQMGYGSVRPGKYLSRNLKSEKGFWKIVALMSGNVVLNVLKTVGGYILKIVRWIAIPITMLSGIWQGLQGSSLFKGIGAGIAGYDITTGITKMSRGLQLELQSKGVLNLVRSFMLLWHQGAKFVSGFLSVFRILFSAIQSVGHAIGNFIKEITGWTTLADVFMGPDSPIGKMAGTLLGIAAAVAIVKPAIAGLMLLLGPWGMFFVTIATAALLLVDAMGGVGNTILGLSVLLRTAMNAIYYDILKIMDLMASTGAFGLIRDWAHILGIANYNFDPTDVNRAGRFAAQPNTPLDIPSAREEFRQLLAAQANQKGNAENKAVLEDIKKILQEGKTIELDGYKVNKATDGYKKQQERRGY